MAFADLIRRGDDELPSIPNWAIIAMVLEILVFLPFWVFVSYSLAKIYPIFAMLEDENAPSYAPLALSDDPDNGAPKHPSAIPAETVQPSRPISSSLRSIRTHLTSHGGFMRSHLKGSKCAAVATFLASIISSIVRRVLPAPFGRVLAPLLAALLLTQFSTAFVHIVITPHSPTRFYKRLPAFAPTLKATFRPILLLWAGIQAATLVAYLAAALLGISDVLASFDAMLIYPPAFVLLRFAAVAFLFTTVLLALQIPALLVLVRVQASLLPPDQDVIFAMDRSFGGKLEPAVAGGSGVSVADAWSTFSRDGWRRLVLLYAKILGVSSLGVVCFAIPQALILVAVLKK